MRVLGIIAEYNPFHYGHLYHLMKSKELIQPDFVIAVQSGNFTQRGEAAITDKWIRAEAAVHCGADLVLELPVVYAVQTAELFAYGAVQTLNHTGLTDYLSFGSEIDDLEQLKAIAELFVPENPIYQNSLKSFLQQGLSFPAARCQAILHDLAPSSEESAGTIKRILSDSNSILAVEYLKALKRTGSPIAPVTVHRIRSSYGSQRIKKGITSAASIRKEILQHGLDSKVENAVPQAVFRILSDAFAHGMGPVRTESLENLLLGILRRSSTAEIKSWMDVSEGLENRIQKSAQNASSLEDLILSMKTRRYTQTRLQRILIHGLIDLTTEAFRAMNDDTGPKYLRILAFSEHAAPLLKQLKKTARVPIITKAAHIAKEGKPVQEMFAFDRLAGDLYSLGMKNPNGRKGDRDYTHRIRPIP